MPPKAAPMEAVVPPEPVDESTLWSSPGEGLILDMLPPDLKSAVLAARARLGVTDITAEIRVAQIFIRRAGDEIAADLAEPDAIDYLNGLV